MRSNFFHQYIDKMIENNDEFQQRSFLIKILEWFEFMIGKLRLRFDSYIHHSINLYDIIWLEIKLDVGAVYMLILTLNVWLYHIYK